MSTRNLQPSPFAPNQFLVSLGDDDNDEEMSSTFIKKRPLDLTEDLVEGRLNSRLRRCTSPHAQASRGFSEPPQFAAREPCTPPNRPQSPLTRPSREMSLTRSPDRLRHSRKSNGRRHPKLRRSCAGISTRKSLTRESSPALSLPRSPLAHWSPQPMSLDALPATPPPRPPSSYPFGVLPTNSWSARLPWTVASPSSSPYPAHSPPEHPA